MGGWLQPGELDDSSLMEALQQFESAFRLVSDPVDRAYAAHSLVDCLWRMGRKEEARKVLLETIEGLPEGHFMRIDLEFIHACWYWHERRFEQALQILDRILPKSRAYSDVPEGKGLYRDIQVKRGILLTEFQRPREACPVLEEVLSLELPDQEKGDVLYNLDVCYYDLERKDLAKEKFQEALEAGVQRYWAVRAHHYLGLIHFENRAYAWAKQEFEFCERHADEVGLSRKAILEMLAHTCRRLA